MIKLASRSHDCKFMSLQEGQPFCGETIRLLIKAKRRPDRRHRLALTTLLRNNQLSGLHPIYSIIY